MSNTPGDVPERAVETESSGEAIVRRAPKYQSFLLIGVVVGLIVAMALTLIFQRSPEELDASKGELYYSPMQVFGFLLLICVPVGVALFGILAWLIDLRARRRSTVVQVGKVEVRPIDVETSDAAEAQPTASAEETSRDVSSHESVSPNEEDTK